MIRGLKGMEDLLPEQSSNWTALECFLRKQMSLFGFKEIRTPFLESTSLFSRSIGEQTDVVSKEMYTFADKNGESITLRPENTASVIRAYVEHQLHNEHPFLKCFYLGAMFRHERPQKGRLRQFHQLGAEILGSANPSADVESIALLYSIAKNLQIPSLSMQINNVGDASCRPAYKKELQSFLRAHLSELDETSQARIEHNPLRVFDSKIESTQQVLKKAPIILDFLSEECRSHFSRVQEILLACDIPFVVNPRIVRGLDYYTNTVFELVAESGLGAQNVIGGGGRYDNLIAELSGPQTPAVGFALGIERLLLIAPPINKERILRIACIAMDSACELKLSALQNQWRQDFKDAAVSIELLIDKSKLKNALKQADKMSADFAFILGDSELQKNILQVKNLKKHASV